MKNGDILGVFDSDVIGEFIEDVTDSNIVHVAIILEREDGMYVFESMPNIGVQIVPFTDRHLSSNEYTVVSPKNVPVDIEEKTMEMIGMKYSWLSVFLAPFHVKISRKHYCNCVEAVNQVMGSRGYYPKDVINYFI